MRNQTMIAGISKILKIAMTGAMIWMGVSLPIFAESGESTSDFVFDYQETAELLSDYLVADYKVEELVEKCDCEVKIYNTNNQLVRFGKANNDVVKNLISKADFLIQVNDVKYYRLNK